MKLDSQNKGVIFGACCYLVGVAVGYLLWGVQ
jgi:hypothetical protein